MQLKQHNVGTAALPRVGRMTAPEVMCAQWQVSTLERTRQTATATQSYFIQFDIFTAKANCMAVYFELSLARRQTQSWPGKMPGTLEESNCQ